MTTNSWARLLTVGSLTLTMTLAGCTGSGSGSEEADEGRGPAPTTSSDTESPAEDATDGVEQAADEVAPADEIEQAFTIRTPRHSGPDSGYGIVGPVFTRELVLFVDGHDYLHAIDRATGKQRWRVKRRSDTKGGDTPCALIHPTPDAEVVVLNHGGGQLCGNFAVYSLADGSVTEKYDSVPRAGRQIGFELASNSDLVVVDGRTLFLDADDNLLRLEADGTTSSVGSPVILHDSDPEWSAGRLVALPGSDVMMTRIARTDDEFELDEDEDGKLLGFRLSDNDLPELVWTQDVRQLMSSSPGHVFGQLEISSVLPGVVVDVFRSDGGRRTRYRRIDPETGELTSPGYSFDRNEAREVPGFALPYAVDESVLGDDASVFTPMISKGANRPTAIARLDLDSGEAAWSWRIPGAPQKGYSNAVADVVTTSPDGALVYVRTSVNLDTRLWELDAETGEPVRSWVLSKRGSTTSDLYDSDVSIDDGDVLQLDANTGEGPLLGALHR